MSEQRAYNRKLANGVGGGPFGQKAQRPTRVPGPDETKFMGMARDLAKEKNIKLSQAISQMTETHENEYLKMLEEFKS